MRSDVGTCLSLIDILGVKIILCLYALTYAQLDDYGINLQAAIHGYEGLSLQCSRY